MIEKKRATEATPLNQQHKDSEKSAITKQQRYKKPFAVEELETALFELKKLRFPNVPYLTKKTYRDDTANELTRCIIDFVKLYGGQAERISNTGRPIDRRTTYVDAIGMRRTIGSIEWVKGTGTNGTADISATINGRSVKIEVKIGKDKQSEAQKQYQMDIEKAGGIYVIAKDLTSFVEWYNLMFGG